MGGNDGVRPDRDRDPAGRARSARPRDELGRPLPHGADGVERVPEGLARTPLEALAEAQRLLDTGRPFQAHEVLEDAWKAADEPLRQLWKGLAQLAVALTHAGRGNATGTVALLRRGADNLAPYRGSAPYGVQVESLCQWAVELADAVADQRAAVGLPDSPLPPPRLRG